MTNEKPIIPRIMSPVDYEISKYLKEEWEHSLRQHKEYQLKQQVAEAVRPFKQEENKAALRELLKKEGEPETCRQMLDMLSKLPHGDIQIDNHTTNRGDYFEKTLEEINQDKRYEENQQRREEEQKRWTVARETEQRMQYRQLEQQIQHNYQINQTLEMRARPNPFVMPFQNGL